MNKILIVDDEPHNRILLEEVLEEFEEKGIQLLFAANGTEALDLIKTEKPELVFLDAMLPEMDGFHICEKVKSDPGFENIFIAILTAKSQDADKKRAVEAKADMYITKPFKIKVIIEMVNKVFNNFTDL